MDYGYFAEEYRSLLDDVRAINPAIAVDRRNMVLLFDRHQALFAQLQSHPRLRTNIRLHVLGSRVFAEGMAKLTACMVAAAAAPGGN
jgi:hypothetical protein